MAKRVFITPQAKEQLRCLEDLFDKGLLDDLLVAGKAIKALTDPTLWDGPLPEHFREIWEEKLPVLGDLYRDLEESRGIVDRLAREFINWTPA